MIEFEIKLFRNKKHFLPVAVVLLALMFLAFLNYWFGFGNKQLKGAALAEFVSIRASQSTLPALFFIFWVLQRTIHLINTGYYKMFLMLGWPRHKVFLYSTFQVVLHAILFLLLNFVCYAGLSFFNGTNPFQLLFNTDYNALFSQLLYLLAVGFIALSIAFLRPSSVMALPVLVYWLLESWLSSFIHRKLESDAGNFLPFQAVEQLISENILVPSQILIIATYLLFFILLLHFSVQKRMFV